MRQVIAVTGSVGKTSTKEALRRVLARRARPCLGASFNNHWGVPLSLARCPAGARFAVFEIGMNHAGEIDAAGRGWCGRTSPIITTVEPVHLEFFAGIEAIADAKAEIFAGSSPAAPWCSTATMRNSRGCSNARRKLGISRIVSFGARRKIRRAAARRVAACGLFGGACQYPRP